MLSYIKQLLGKKKPKPKAPLVLNGQTQIIPRKQHCISKADINPNALKVLNRLHEHGFQAFLVGGGVRDLLLHKAPKDFDVATNAHPEAIRKIFKNCRLIGRRFRLAHVIYGRDIIEVATFRAAANADDAHPERHLRDGMLIRDNVYGTLEEDVFRRDFTINALYYNIADFSIVDFSGGMRDIHSKKIRLIGDPVKRYQEDPVRMLRAVRFATKLDFEIEPASLAPIPKLASLLLQVPSARLFEEILKLFQRGKAWQNYELMQQLDLLAVLFPRVTDCVEKNKTFPVEKLLYATMRNTDKRISEDKPVTPAFLLAALLWYPLLETTKYYQTQGHSPLPALELAMKEIVTEQCQLLAIPRRFTNIMREIWMLQYRLPRRYGRRPFVLLAHPRFRAAYDFLVLRAEAGEIDQELADWWTQFQFADETVRESMLIKEKSGKRPSRRKRPAAKNTTTPPDA